MGTDSLSTEFSTYVAIYLEVSGFLMESLGGAFPVVASKSTNSTFSLWIQPYLQDTT